jgi:dihydrofolate reductase
VAKLIYGTNASLDGYIEDASGSFDWTEPDEEVHQFWNDVTRGIGTHLLGRRLYETMAVWETDPSLAAESAVTAEFAEVWQDADKVVYSRTLDAPVTKRTRVEREFDPDAVRRLKAEADRDLLVGGAELAGEALRAGVVDECLVVLSPIAVGSGKPAFADGVRVPLALVEERRFSSGNVLLRYEVR